MQPRARNALLVAHVITSVGWFGAVAAFLVLAVVGLASDDAIARSTQIANGYLGWYAIVPAALASLATGVAQGLATPWGLLRHYWVVIKLVLTTLSTLLLLLHMQVIDRVALDGGSHGMRVQLVVDAAAALAVLLVATVLSIFKPKGVTRRGKRFASSAS